VRELIDCHIHTERCGHATGTVDDYVRAAVSKGQFGEIPPIGMVFLRLVTSSLILLALARPRLGGRTAADWRPVLALGLALGAMNWAFYESFARIPLGVAVTIEFVGPLAVAAVGSRPRDLVSVSVPRWASSCSAPGPRGRRRRVRPGTARRRLLALYIVSTATRAPPPGSTAVQRGCDPPSRRSPWLLRAAPARATPAGAGALSVCSFR
jgi:hypothetical protein